MQSGDSEKQWQVTCQCGWRTAGTQSEVISAVQAHGKDTHGQDVTEDQAMSQAVPVSEA